MNRVHVLYLLKGKWKGRRITYTFTIFLTLHGKTPRPFSFVYLHGFLNNLNKKMTNSTSQQPCREQSLSESRQVAPPAPLLVITNISHSLGVPGSELPQASAGKQHEAPLWADKTRTNRLLPTEQTSEPRNSTWGPTEIWWLPHCATETGFTIMASCLWVKNNIRSWCER